MILANSFLSLLSPAAPKGARGDAPAAGGDFSALFAAAALPGVSEGDAAPEQAEPKADPAALLALSLAATGKPATLHGKSGKILPLPLPPGNPVPAGDAEVDELAAAEEEQPAAAMDEAAPAPQSVPAVQIAPIIAPLLPAAGPHHQLPDNREAAPASAVPTPLPPATPALATMPAVQNSTAANGALQFAGQPVMPKATELAAPQEARPGVTLVVASQPMAPVAKAMAVPVAPAVPHQVVTQQAAAQPLIAPTVAPQSLATAVVAELAPTEARPRQTAKASSAASHAALAPLAMPAPVQAQMQAPMQAPLLADAATPFPLMPVQAAAQAPAAAGQDLAAIVDRLSAAREALAPTTAALSIDHAEFGELSLRFDQKADGALTVQLAAATPEAHRAISAAMGAEGGQFLSAEGQPQPQAQPQAQLQAQAQPQQSASNTSSTGLAAERDPRSGQSHRQDQSPRQQQQAPCQPAANRSNPGSGHGVFA